MNLAPQDNRSFCPASLCRLLRGIAAAGGAQQTGAQPGPVAPPSTAAIAGQSFTIAAILGLKARDTFSECSSGIPNQGQRTKPRPAIQNQPPPITNAHHTSKSKRVRTIFTPEQLERLEAEFERQQYMVGPERLYLAHALQLTEAQVKVWFQNRRIKWRKQHLELTQQRLALARRQQMAEQLDASSSCSIPEGS